MRRFLMPAALVAAAPLLFAACGEDEDPVFEPTTTAEATPDGEATTPATTSPEATPNTPQGQQGMGLYDVYVTEVCDAVSEFRDDLGDAGSDAEALQATYMDFRDAWEDIAAPADLGDWHRETGEDIDRRIGTLEPGNVTDNETISADYTFPPVPDEFRDEVQQAAQDAEECENLSVFS